MGSVVDEEVVCVMRVGTITRSHDHRVFSRQREICVASARFREECGLSQIRTGVGPLNGLGMFAAIIRLLASHEKVAGVTSRCSSLSLEVLLRDL
jgi:hypothetical protein